MIAAIGVSHPDLVMKSLVPVVMASVLSIYGLVVSLLATRNSNKCINIHTGLAIGLTGIASGYAIGRI
ncbi:hypothetical protein MXB_4901, partial [Myxobolus squamalis]